MDPMVTKGATPQDYSASVSDTVSLVGKEPMMGVWKRGFPFAARYNLRLRVRSRQLNSGELDVTPMCLASTMTTSRSNGVETRHTRTLTTLQNPPYNMYRVGANAHWARRVNLRSVFSNQECTSHCHITQDTHYSSCRKPESQSHHSQSIT